MLLINYQSVKNAGKYQKPKTGYAMVVINYRMVAVFNWHITAAGMKSVGNANN